MPYRSGEAADDIVKRSFSHRKKDLLKNLYFIILVELLRH
jgi:hypothetical protein